MKNLITIIMYHYVRDLKNSRYPNIKGLDTELFLEQIKYLLKYYHIISIEEIIYKIKNNKPFNEKYACLTFDDGYSDHFQNVFPILEKYKIKGAFYPTAKIIEKNKILDVNKIHFILASKNETNPILKEIKNELKKYKKTFRLLEFAEYYKKLAHKSRYDSADIVFIKRLLQVELVEPLRKIIVNSLFEKFVSRDEKAFSKELYMSSEELMYMARSGMHIGSHGYEHYWLGSLDEQSQRNDIDKSLKFLKRINGSLKNWTICYPYGSFNDYTLKILDEKECSIGLTTHVNIANLVEDYHLTLPRLNTNDIPKNENSKPNQWYIDG